MQAGAVLRLTPKGVDELRNRTYKLDFKARNILFLIETGQASVAAIAQKSPIKQDELALRIEILVADGFIAGATSADTHGGAGGLQLGSLLAGISLPEARFALSNFCLDVFGIDGQATMDLIDRCVDENQLRNVLSTIVATVEKSHRGQLALLQSVIDAINATRD